MQNRPYILSVLSGPNAGAAVSLAAGVSTIGTSDSDTVILDDAIEQPVSFGLSGDKLRVLAQHVGVTIRGVGPVGTNAKVATDLPAVVRLSDETLVAVSRFGTDEKPRRWSLALLPLALITGAIWADKSGEFPWISSTQATLLGQWTSLTTAPDITTALAPLSDPAPALKEVICSQTCLMDEADALTTQIKAAGLNDLSVLPEAGIIRVVGIVDHGQSQDWRDLRQTFETERSRGIALIAEISERPAPPELDVLSVWLGTVPEIRLRNGDVLSEGSTTNNGWIVQAISPDGISVTKNGHSQTLTY